MTRLHLVVALLPGLLIVSAAFAAPDSEAGVRVTKDVAFLAPGRAEKLDVYQPAPCADGRPHPAIVWIHGGGWTGGTKNESRADNICRTAATAGYVAVSIDYRLGDGAWPTNLFDCKNAVRFLRANAARYSVDPDRIAVAGGSAGGHLALMVALTPGVAGLDPTGDDTPYPGVSDAVRCAVNMYGITNITTRRDVSPQGVPGELAPWSPDAMKVYGAADTTAPVLRLASPVTHVRSDSVPLLTLHGKADATVDYLQAEELDRVARESGARHELMLIDGVGHTFDLEQWTRKPLPRDLRPVFLGFLARHLGEP
jgi:acetyl esterase/lipase